MPGDPRDAIALGPPSVLSAWAFDLLRDACDLVPERAAIQIIDRQDKLEPGGDRGPLIYLSHYPSASLLAECGNKRAPILLCLDDPVESVRCLREAASVSVVEALRQQTAAAASYAELSSHPRLLILHRHVAARASEVIDVVLKHFRIELTSAQREALHTKRLGPKGKEADLESSLKACAPGYAAPGEAETRFSAKEVAMIGGVLAPLLEMSFRADAGPIVWPIEAFLSGDRPDTPATLVAELTGAARILYYGPYFYLPAGSWRARMMVGFSEGAKRTPFSVEVFAGQSLLAIATMVPEDRGVYHATFEFAHEDAAKAVEVRVRSDRGAIEGQIALGNVEFTREAIPEAEGVRTPEGRAMQNRVKRLGGR